MAILYKHFESVSSTNDVVKRLIKESALLGPICVTSDHQTQGRGTKSRSWYSEPSSSLLYSYAMPLLSHNISPSGIVYKSADLVIDQVKESYAIQLEKEWPNDLILNGRKCAGILLELLKSKDSMWIVFGLGLNINTARFPESLAHCATSFFLEFSNTYDCSLMTKKLSEKLQLYFMTL